MQIFITDIIGHDRLITGSHKFFMSLYGNLQYVQTVTHKGMLHSQKQNKGHSQPENQSSYQHHWRPPPRYAHPMPTWSLLTPSNTGGALIRVRFTAHTCTTLGGIGVITILPLIEYLYHGLHTRCHKSFKDQNIFQLSQGVSSPGC